MRSLFILRCFSHGLSPIPFAEDPYLNGEYAVQYIKGMQEGDDPRYLKTSACAKHAYAYSLENWDGMDRYHFDSIVTDEDAAEVYLPAFQSAVEKGHASSVMVRRARLRL